jgi:hypothetical protein
MVGERLASGGCGAGTFDHFPQELLRVLKSKKKRKKGNKIDIIRRQGNCQRHDPIRFCPSNDGLL